MHRSTLSLLFTLTLAVPSGAQTPSSPSGANVASGQGQQSGAIQTGTYDLELVMGGGAREATLVVTSMGDSLDVKITVGDHSPALKSVVRKGSHLSITGGSVGAVIAYELNFNGTAIDGTFTYNGDGGTVTGKRRK